MPRAFSGPPGPFLRTRSILGRCTNAVPQDAAGKLQGSCPSEMPQTPYARLDAVKARLVAMVNAMNTVRPKLQDFYASLNDDQKAKFNIMAPPPNASAPQGQSSGQ